ncbi:hypothetical protein AAC387_Pa07g2084 [Persea americana]
MDRRLYEASLTGNTTSLQKLLDEDESILDKTLAANPPETPLHIAALRGHVEFTAQILRPRPELAHELNSQGLSPLHLASANGHVGVAKEFLKLAPDSISKRDREGRTPLHTAAATGRVSVLEELTRHKPELIGDVTSRGETVLHLCVKHEQVEALKMLVGVISDAELLNQKDDNGNTILHLSAAMKHVPVIKFLIKETIVEVNSRNMNGLTALDLLTICPRESTGEMEIAEILRRGGAKRAWELPKPNGEDSEVALVDPPQFQDSEVKQDCEAVVSLASMSWQIKELWIQEMKQKHDNDKRNTMMVISVLIVTVALQATLTPPGGPWQDDSQPVSGNNFSNMTRPTIDHEAGTAILNQKNPTGLAFFWFFNKLAFLSSLFLIFRLGLTNSDDADNNTKASSSNWSSKALYFVSLLSMELMYITSSTPITAGTHRCVILADLGAFMVVGVLLLPLQKWWRKFRM